MREAIFVSHWEWTKLAARLLAISFCTSSIAFAIWYAYQITDFRVSKPWQCPNGQTATYKKERNPQKHIVSVHCQYCSLDASAAIKPEKRQTETQ